MGYIYFLYSPACRKIKIGFSENPSRRLSGILGSSPDGHLVPLAVVPGKKTDEQFLHYRFREARSHREWFYPEPSLIRFLCEAQKNSLDCGDGEVYLLLTERSKTCLFAICEELKMKSLFDGIDFEVPGWIPKDVRGMLPSIVPTQDDIKNYERISRLDPREVSEEVLTPGICLLIIKNAVNRKVRSSQIIGLSQDIKHNRYYKGDSMFLFDQNGDPKNGCHRCLACIIAGKPITVVTRRRIEAEEIHIIDTGVKRTMNDSEAMKGLTPDQTLYNDKNASIVRLAYSRGKQENAVFSLPTLRMMIDHFREPLEWINGICNSYPKSNQRRVGMALVKAVFLRAYVSRREKDKLTYAYRYLLSAGEEVEKNQIARLPGTDSLRSLRKYLTETIRSTPTSVDTVSSCYKRTQRMLSAFLAGQELDKTHASDDEQFPIPSLSFIPAGQNTHQTVADRLFGQDLMKKILSWSETADEQSIRLQDFLERFLPKNECSRKMRERVAEFIKRRGSLQLGRHGSLIPVCPPGQIRVNKYVFRRNVV